MTGEVKRLKEALQDILEEAKAPQRFYDQNGTRWVGSDGYEYEDTATYLDFANDIVAIASKALEGVDGKDKRS